MGSKLSSEVAIVYVFIIRRVLEINPASPTESVIECERIIRCELGTSSSSKLPDRHKDVVALLPPEATSEPLDSIFVRISRGGVSGVSALIEY